MKILLLWIILLTMFVPLQSQKQLLSMGFFKTEINATQVLYFYSPNYDQEENYFKTDSIVFSQNQNGVFEINSAPHWLFPKHMKLDYEILLFEIRSVGKEYVKVIGNSLNNKEVFVSRFDGKIMYWPDFLLNVNSIELIHPATQQIHIKPMDHSSEIDYKYSLLQPVELQGDWIKVNLIDDNYQLIETGWIQWKKDNNLLIKYFLLS